MLQSKLASGIRLLQHNGEEKLARQRPGYNEHSFFLLKTKRSSVKDELPKPMEHTGDNSKNVLSEEIFAFDTTFDLSDDVLANTPVPENTLTSNINNFCANSVFNNCTVDFCHEKK